MDDLYAINTAKTKFWQLATQDLSVPFFDATRDRSVSSDIW
jgi:hypothetical protein